MYSLLLFRLIPNLHYHLDHATGRESLWSIQKIDWHNFTNFGVRHCQIVETFEITLDQTEYGKGISVIVHPELKAKDKEEFCSNAVHQSYWSIGGAIAYATLTRPDIGVFVSALQRHN